MCSSQGVELSNFDSNVGTANSSVNTNATHHTGGSNVTSHKQLVFELRSKACQIMFGLSDNIPQQWPGLFLFYAELEDSLQELLNHDYDMIWKVLGRAKPTQPCEVWYWCFAILTTIFDNATISQGLSAAEPLSLENIYRILAKTGTADPRTIGAHGKRQTLRAIFATLCWLSLALKPVFTVTTPQQIEGRSTSNGADELLQVQDTFRTVSLDLFSKRPLGKLFRSFHIPSQATVAEPSNPYAHHSGTLHASSVNFHSLHIIAKLRINWVDTLASHLDWNQQERTVSIFRFPSTCVVHIKSNKRIGALSGILAELLPPEAYQDSPTRDLSLLYREVLLTYRLLFGHSSESRDLARDLLNKVKKSAQEVDPFLETLCTVPQSRSLFRRLISDSSMNGLPAELFPASVIDVRGALIESGSYSAHLDFPAFGTRLLALQDHNLRQQPNKVRDLWRDRRNPLQWYTFWAVIWVGGISIILSALQLAVSTAQLYFAPGSS